MTPAIRRLVIDVMKPQESDTLDVVGAAADSPGVDGINAVLVETDRDVQNLKLTVEGNDIDVPAVEAAVSERGGAVHSIDEVVCGDRLVEQSATPQDR